MKACIFISDEGFGHIVRQKAIISELLKKKVSVTVVTSTKIIVLKNKFKT
jgi:spore coat polysaccharide biosynthesis predicted glycosyltransferase SpsG